MRRRDFLVGAGATGLAWSAAANAQTRVFRIGYLANLSPEKTQALFDAFREALQSRGYVEGTNLTIIPKTSPDHLDGAAAELMALKPDVIVAWATPAVGAARRVTQTIPIVMVGVADPVAVGFVKSLSRPHANITGTTNLARDLGGKTLELLIEIVPDLTSIAVLRNPDNPASAFQLRDIELAATALQRKVILIDIAKIEDWEPACLRARSEGAKAAVALADTSLIDWQDRIADTALRTRLPIIFSRSENVRAGGLMAYGPSLIAQFRTTAAYVDRLLKGASPADLPVQQPTTFELVINLKTAKALELKVPEAFLLRADSVIE